MIGLTKDYYLPRLEFIPGVKPPTQFENKFGGMPWGTSEERWPRCAHCDSVQSLLAQLRHEPPKLDLGRPGRILYVFQCARWHENGCDSFDPASGANACFVLEPEELCEEVPLNSGAPLLAHLETRVLSWKTRVETLRDEFARAYFDPKNWRTVPTDECYTISGATKLGGVPFWGNVGPSDIPAGNWRFVLQMSDYHFIPGEKSEAAADYLAAMNIPALRNQSRAGWNCPWANFGQGVGYVFLSEEEPIKGIFTWQRL